MDNKIKVERVRVGYQGGVQICPHIILANVKRTDEAGEYEERLEIHCQICGHHSVDIITN